MAGVEQNRYKTNNGSIKHLPQTSNTVIFFTSFNKYMNQQSYVVRLYILVLRAGSGNEIKDT